MEHVSYRRHGDMQQHSTNGHRLAHCYSSSEMASQAWGDETPPGKPMNEFLHHELGQAPLVWRDDSVSRGTHCHA